MAAYKDRKLIFMSEFLLLRIAESTTYFPTNFQTWLPNRVHPYLKKNNRVVH